MNTYTVVLTDNPITGSQTTQTVSAHDFVFGEEFVLFIDASNKVVFAAPFSREPVITLTVAAA